MAHVGAIAPQIGLFGLPEEHVPSNMWLSVDVFYVLGHKNWIESYAFELSTSTMDNTPDSAQS